MSDRLLAAVRTVLTERRIAGPVVAAVSGGADSVALLRALAASGVPVVVAHANHGLRGAESDADEAFVRALAGSLGIPFQATRLAIPPNENFEAAARRLRYEWLHQVARESGASWIATGHTADDQAETVLHRLIRGTGLQGLRGIATTKFSGEGQSSEPSAVCDHRESDGHVIDPRPALGSEDCASPLNGRVVRPMLAVTRSEVLEFLNELGQSFRTDSTNADPRFTRNRLRHELLPLLKSFNPEIVAVLGRLAEQASETFDHLEVEALALFERAERPRAGAMLIFDRTILEAAPPLLARELLRAVWRREGWSMDAMTFDHWRRAAALIPGDYPDGVRMKSVGSVIQLSRTLPKPA